jgi:hypothetical protein
VLGSFDFPIPFGSVDTNSEGIQSMASVAYRANRTLLLKTYFSHTSTSFSYSMPGKNSINNIPKNWPAHLPYLISPSYSPNLSLEQRASLRIKPQDALSIPPNVPKGPSPLVKITQIADPTHPACGQAGLFATKDLKPGSFIIEYLGVMHSSPPALPPPTSTLSPLAPPAPEQVPDPHASSNYDLSLDRSLSLAIDAAASGNEARFINDYRGISPRPNAEFREVWNEARKERGMAVWVLAVGKSGKRGGRGRGVRKGEEVVVSYGRGFWGARREEAEDGMYDGGGGAG